MWRNVLRPIWTTVILCTELVTILREVTLVVVSKAMSLVRTTDVQVSLYCSKGLFTLSEREIEIFFDLCRCSVWTLNWILHEPIWKRCRPNEGEIFLSEISLGFFIYHTQSEEIKSLLCWCPLQKSVNEQAALQRKISTVVRLWITYIHRCRFRFRSGFQYHSCTQQLGWVSESDSL